MRNAIIIILSLFFFILFNSCREDGDWGNENAGQFGFTIERDNNFIEKSNFYLIAHYNTAELRQIAK